MHCCIFKESSRAQRAFKVPGGLANRAQGLLGNDIANGSPFYGDCRLLAPRYLTGRTESQQSAGFLADCLWNQHSPPETFWMGQAGKFQWNEIQQQKKSFFKNYPVSCSPHAAHIMCESQSWCTSVCNKDLQLLEKIRYLIKNKRYLIIVSMRLLLPLIKDTTLDSYSLLFSHQRLQGGNLSIYISTFPKASVQSTALVATGLIQTQDPTIPLKFVPVWAPSGFTRKQPTPLDRLPINCDSCYTGIFSDATTIFTI